MTVLERLEQKFKFIATKVTKHRLVERFDPVYRLHLEESQNLEVRIKQVLPMLEEMLHAGVLSLVDDYDQKGKLLADVVEVIGVIHNGRGLKYIQINGLNSEKLDGKQQEDD